MRRHRQGIGDSGEQNRSPEQEEFKSDKKKPSNKVTFELEKSTCIILSIVCTLLFMFITLYVGFKANIFNFNFEYEDMHLTPDIMVLYEQYDRNGDHRIDLYEFEPLAHRIFNSKVNGFF